MSTSVLPSDIKQTSMRRQVVAAAIAAALLTLGLAATIAYQHGAFTRTTDLYFLTESAQGMAAGTRVRLAGVHVGTIRSMTLLPDARVKVVLQVESDPAALLKADASADLVREQLQPAAIELRIGKAEQPLSPDDPQLKFSKRATITEVADDLGKRLGPILEDFKVVSGGLRDHRGDIETILVEAGKATRELASTTQTLHAIVAELQPNVAALAGGAKNTLANAGQTAVQARELMSSAHRDVAKLGGVVDKLDDSLAQVDRALPALLTRLQTTLDGAHQLLVDGRAVTGAASSVLPGAIHEVPQIVEDTRETIGAARRIWPFSSRSTPGPVAMPIDSADPMAVRTPAAR